MKVKSSEEDAQHSASSRTEVEQSPSKVNSATQQNFQLLTDMYSEMIEENLKYLSDFSPERDKT